MYLVMRNSNSEFVFLEPFESKPITVSGLMAMLIELRYALALFSGANRIEPFTQYSKVFVYVDEPSAIIDKLNLKKVDSGSNVVLLSKGEVVPASYIRTYADNEGHKHAVQVDLLSPEYGGTDPAHHHQPVQDILARRVGVLTLRSHLLSRKDLRVIFPVGQKMQLPCALLMPSLALR